MRRRSQARHAEREVTSIEEFFTDDGHFREEASPSPLPDDAVLAGEAREMILRAVDTLPDTDRAIVVLADQEEMTAREIGGALGLTEAAVKSRLHGARVPLRRLLGDYVREARAVPAAPRSTQTPATGGREVSQ